MSFYVYGRDRKTGEAVHRFLSTAATEGEARTQGEARGIEVTAVVAREDASMMSTRPHDAHAPASKPPHESHASDGAALPQASHARSDARHTRRSQGTKKSVRKEKATDAQRAPIRVMPALIAVNVLWFLLMAFNDALTSPDALLGWGASYGPITFGHAWWRLLTASFVHVGLIDLVVHMAALAFVGWVAEQQFGSIAFLIIYLIAGIAGNLVAQQADALAVVASATAPVGGCIGALLALMVWHRGELDEQVPRACAIVAFVAFFVFAEFDFDLGWSALISGLVCGFAAGIALSPSGAPSETGGMPKLILTAGIAAVLISAGGAWLQSKNRGLSGTLAVLDAADALDRRVAAQLQKARSDWQSCLAQSADIAAVTQREILPDWRAVRLRLEQLAPYPASIAIDAAKKLDAMRRREATLDVPSPSAQWSPDAGSPRQHGDC